MFNGGDVDSIVQNDRYDGDFNYKYYNTAANETFDSSDVDFIVQKM